MDPFEGLDSEPFKIKAIFDRFLKRFRRDVASLGLIASLRSAFWGSSFWGLKIEKLIRDLSPVIRPIVWRSSLRAIREAEDLLRASRDMSLISNGRSFSDLLSKNLSRAIVERFSGDTQAGLQYALDRALYSQPGVITDVQTLAKVIRPYVGLTEKQVKWIADQRVRLIAANVPDVDRIIARRIEDQLQFRSLGIGNSALANSVGKSRHEAWRRSIEAGEIPETVLKRWFDQRDRRVRPKHRRQSAYPAIPFDQAYALFDVQHPPAPEHGCRCYERLFLVEEV